MSSRGRYVQSDKFLHAIVKGARYGRKSQMLWEMRKSDIPFRVSMILLTRRCLSPHSLALRTLSPTTAITKKPTIEQYRIVCSNLSHKAMTTDKVLQLKTRPALKALYNGNTELSRSYPTAHSSSHLLGLMAANLSRLHVYHSQFTLATISRSSLQYV